MRRLLALLALPALLALLAGAASAQITVFESGYVVIDGERVAGWVSLGTPIENARAVRFRRGRTGEGEALGPDAVQGFGTANGVHYRAGRYPVGGDTVLAFARLVRDGRADLLVLATDAGTRYFVRLDDGPPVALASDDVRQPLAATFADCPQDVASVTIDAEALRAAVDRFNRCVDRGYEPDLARTPGTRPDGDYRVVEVGGELGVGALAGRFVRPDGEIGPYDEPNLMAPTLGAALRVRPPWRLPVTFVGEAGYAHGVARMWINVYNGRIIALDMAHAGLGLRVDFNPVVTLGVGGTAGWNWRRTVEDDVGFDPQEGYIGGVISTAFLQSRGAYAEAVFELPEQPVTFLMRAQLTKFYGRRQTLAGNLRGSYDSGYSIRSVGVAARWRFGG